MDGVQLDMLRMYEKCPRYSCGNIETCYACGHKDWGTSAGEVADSLAYNLAQEIAMRDRQRAARVRVEQGLAEQLTLEIGL